ncbi:MAG TPA: ABC transporter ATP-binding protein [Spirochaetia bacterium]|nr:ABC transporter ATP-binding protein [Spirochaetales bacterium]HRY80148.1 ABC transporter ATP-binding protein [Spirochaetia bacterium]
MPYSLFELRKAFGDLPVLDGFSLDLPERKVTAILGPSGCGKTTLLHILSGLIPPDSGERRGLGEARFSYVFQEPRLVPSLTALENVELVLRSSFGVPERRERALRFLEGVGLSEARDQRPRQLSGGMRQRVSLARAFAYPADILLLDEPFQSVDLRTRTGLMDAFLELQTADPRTVVFVTHEVKEALYLGDIVTVLSDKPARILDRKELLLPRERRRYGSADLSDVEAALYRLILG